MEPSPKLASLEHIISTVNSDMDRLSQETSPAEPSSIAELVVAEKPRPHAPVAKTLNQRELQKHSRKSLSLSPMTSSHEKSVTVQNAVYDEDHGQNNDTSPNLPEAMRQLPHLSHHIETSMLASMSPSPPAFMESPSLRMRQPTCVGTLSSPYAVPAAPPGTPYTPSVSLPTPMLQVPALPAATTYNPLLFDTSPPILPSFSPPSLPHAALFPTFHPTNTHTQPQQSLLSQAIHLELQRTASLLSQEALYTTLSQFQHALARERRYSLSLVQQLALLQQQEAGECLSCKKMQEEEGMDEKRINHFFKNDKRIEEESRQGKQTSGERKEKQRQELRRRLLELNREKTALERQLNESLEEEKEWMENEKELGQQMQQHQQEREGVQCSVSSTAIIGAKQADNSECEGRKHVDEHTAALLECSSNVQDDQEDEEEVEILEDRPHDPEMEEELNKLLELKQM